MVVAPSGDFVELPGVNGEDSRKKGEEDTCDLESENAGSMGERTQEGRSETSCSAGEAAAAFGE